MFSFIRPLLAIVILTLISIKGFAYSNAIEICTLKPQDQSLTTLLLQIAQGQKDYEVLLEWTKDLNRQKDINGKIDSYNFILPWKKRPDQFWLKAHCQYMGYITPVEMHHQRRNWNYSIPTHQLHLRPIEIVLSENPKTTSPKKVVTKIEETAPLIIIKPAKKVRVIETQPEKPLRQKLASKDNPILKFGLVPFYAIEYVNGEGSGIRNEFDLISYGAEVSLALRLFPRFYLYGKGRFSVFDVKYTELPSEVSLVEDREFYHEIGFDYHIWDNMQLGLSYRKGEMLLFRRSVPVTNLETYLEEMNLVHVTFGFLFYKSNALRIGFNGTYGVSLFDDEGRIGYDYRTLLYVSYIEDDQFDLSLTGGYELNKVQLDSTLNQITEINRNRYIIYLNFTQKF